jgi:hypothetical protein
MGNMPADPYCFSLLKPFPVAFFKHMYDYEDSEA